MGKLKDDALRSDDLKGKTVLVTGAARRIGREIALAAARAGGDVAITYLTSERQARQTVAELLLKHVACQLGLMPRTMRVVHMQVSVLTIDTFGLDC